MAFAFMLEPLLVDVATNLVYSLFLMFAIAYNKHYRKLTHYVVFRFKSGLYLSFIYTYVFNL